MLTRTSEVDHEADCPSIRFDFRLLLRYTVFHEEADHEMSRIKRGEDPKDPREVRMFSRYRLDWGV